MESTDRQRILDKIRKLLALAKSTSGIGNIQEAAAAAGKAQELIERYSIEAAMLFENAPQGLSPIIQKNIYQRPAGKGRLPTWILRLAGGIADANRVYIWYDATNYEASITAAGTEENIAKVEELLSWLIAEVARLYEDEKPDNLGRGEGKRWSNSFRLGAVTTISKRLAEAVKQAVKALTTGASEEEYRTAIQSGDPQKVLELDSKKYSIAKVDAALVRLNNDYTRTVAWVEETQKLRKGSVRHHNRNQEAYNAGIKAGHRANIQPN